MVRLLPRCGGLLLVTAGAATLLNVSAPSPRGLAISLFALVRDPQSITDAQDVDTVAITSWPTLAWLALGWLLISDGPRRCGGSARSDRRTGRHAQPDAGPRRDPTAARGGARRHAPHRSHQWHCDGLSPAWESPTDGDQRARPRLAQPGGGDPEGKLSRPHHAHPGRDAVATGLGDARPAEGKRRPSRFRRRSIPPAGAPSVADDTEVVVQRGDTLWSIAARHLGPSATDDQISHEWPRWWSANHQLVGRDPDLIKPGQRLTPPPTER